jgi:hypothetical protein
VALYTPEPDYLLELSRKGIAPTLGKHGVHFSLLIEEMQLKTPEEVFSIFDRGHFRGILST